MINALPLLLLYCPRLFCDPSSVIHPVYEISYLSTEFQVCHGTTSVFLFRVDLLVFDPYGIYAVLVMFVLSWALIRCLHVARFAVLLHRVLRRSRVYNGVVLYIA